MWRQRPPRQWHEEVPYANARLLRLLPPRGGVIRYPDGRVPRGEAASLPGTHMRARRGPVDERVLQFLVLRGRDEGEKEGRMRTEKESDGEKKEK